MNKNRWITGATLSVLLGATGIALGQLHQPAMSGAGRNIIYPTPAQKAIYKQIIDLDQAAAAALDAGRCAEAEDDARQSMSLGHGPGVAQELLASALNAEGKTQEALEAYKVMADAGSDEPADLLPYSLLLLKAGHWAQAVAAFNKSLPFVSEPLSGGHAAVLSAYSHFSPNVPQPHELETALHVVLGATYDSTYSWGRHSQDNKALAEYAQAYSLSPRSAVVNLYYGRRLWKMHRFAEAKTAFAKAVQLDHGLVGAAAQKSLHQWTRP